MKVVLIEESVKRLRRKAPARELYQGVRFQLALKWAKRIRYDRCFVLSSAHGLIEPDTEIKPHSGTLGRKSLLERAKWGLSIKQSLEKHAPHLREIIILAGEDCVRQLFYYYPDGWFPLEGLTEEAQKRFLAR